MPFFIDRFRPIHATAAAIVCFAILQASLAQAGASLVGVLNKVESSRAQAFGGAASALGLDPTLIWLNPAAAASVPPSITLAGQKGIFGEGTGQAILTGRSGNATWTLGALYYDLGTAVLNDSTGGSRLVSLQQDFLLSAGYAANVSEAIAAGIALKALNSRLLEAGTAQTVAADLGVQVRLTDNVKWGAALLNLGPKVRYLSQPIPLPTTVRSGFAFGYRVTNLLTGAPGADTIIFSADAVCPINEKIPSLNVGGEYQFHNSISVRAGTKGNLEDESFAMSAGFGFNIQNYRIDYGISLNGPFDSPQTLSLTIDLPSAKRTRRASRPAEPLSPSITFTPESRAAPAEIGAAPESVVKRDLPLEKKPPVKEKDAIIEDLNRQIDEMMEKAEGIREKLEELQKISSSELK